MEGDKIGDGGESLLATAVLHQLLDVILLILFMLMWIMRASCFLLLVVVF